MAAYETEEQQVEALKQWWKENSASLFFGLAIGLAGIFGWQYYDDYTTGHAQTASDMFNVINEQVKRSELTDINKLEALTTEYRDTPYAAAAALAAASYYFEKGEMEQAIRQYQWVLANSDIEENRQLASLRLAQLHIAQGQLDAAESLLQSEHPQAFSARYAELRGDLYVARGDHARARAAYDEAIRQQASPTPWLVMKRENLGEAEAD